MLNAVLSGVAAGAVGTAALNVATYVDVLVRGRPESQVPAEVAEKIAAGAGIDLGGGDGTPTSDDQQKQRQQTAQNRKSGLGALMGYGTGLGVGAAYGVIRLVVRDVPAPLAAVLLGAAAMATSDVPAVRLGVTDPSEWGASGWLADLIPHLLYGLFTALAYEAFAGDRRRRLA